MSNAAKHRKKAAEFEQLKQIDRAIASYVRAIEESESDGEDVDVALLNKVGDLALRQGRVPDAVTYYERAVEHYATAGLFNNAIALCNKILRNAPGRSNVYFTLGRICARKGLRGDATRNFLEYAARMQQEGRVEEAMRALGEVADLMPELTEVRRLVDEHAVRAGVELPRRRTPLVTEAVTAPAAPRFAGDKSSNLIFLEVDYSAANARLTPPIAPRAQQLVEPPTAVAQAPTRAPLNTPPIALPFIDLDAPTVVVRSASPALPNIELVADNETAAIATSQTPVSVRPVQQPIVEGTTAQVEQHEASVAEPSGDSLEPTQEQQTDELDGAPFLDLPMLDLPMLDLLGTEHEADTSTSDDALESFAELPMLEVPTLEWENDGAAEELVALEPMELGHEDFLSVDLEPVVLDQIEFGQSLDEPTRESFIELPIELTGAPSKLDTPEADVIDAVSVADVPGSESNATIAIDTVDAAHDTAADAVADVDAGVQYSQLPNTQFDETASETPVESLAESQAPSLDAQTHHTSLTPTTSRTPQTSQAPLASDAIESPRETPIATPVDATTPFRSRTPLSATPIPAIEAAIEAGTEAAARAAAARPANRRPPFRLDPHDFILPGELPPLLVDDTLVEAGLGRASAQRSSLPTPIASVAFVTPVGTPRIVPSIPRSVATPRSAEPIETVDLESDDSQQSVREIPVDVYGEFTSDSTEGVAGESATAADARDGEEVVEQDANSVDEIDAGLIADFVAEVDVDVDTDGDVASDPAIDAERELRATIEADVAVRMTPSLPIAAVAAEANSIAESRRDELRAAVADAPQDWALRRRLAEALFEAGQREAALAELEASLTGFVNAGQIADGADVSEMLVGVSPERVAYHQKRVELAVRLNDEVRLRFAYLDLADALVRSGEEARAQAVYVRVLEIDPLDDRARAALGSSAPPPPPPKPTADEAGFVNLSDWLRDDEAPASTRMRMREPVVSGDEQADFAALLRHFKDGVSRSLGDEDFESRYDLGVAFKEMGLLDDAIGEFQKALRSKTHRLPAYEALGQCFVEQGQYQVAATVLSRALHEPGLNDEQRVGVLYLLAYSCEALQRWSDARSYFQRVYATDINFRDVAARLAALEQVAT